MDFSNLFSQQKQQTSALQSFNDRISGNKKNQVSLPKSSLLNNVFKQDLVAPKVNSAPIRNTPIPADTLSPALPQVPQIPSAPIPSMLSTTPVFNSFEQEKPKAPSLKDDVTKKMQELISGGSNVDTFALRQELQLDAKRKLSTDLENKILQTKQDYENKIIELEKNKEGKLAGNLNAQINKFSQDANRDMAQLAIEYKIANDDYQGVQQTIQAYENDLKAKRDWELKALQTSWDFIKDDLTESEKLAITQAHDFNKIDYEQQAKDFAIQSQASGYQQMLNQGLITPDKIPANVLSYINTQGYISPEQKTAIATNVNNMNRVFSVINDPKFNQAVGKLRTPGIFDISGDRELIRQNINTVISALTLDNLAKMKGTPSDRDITVVQSATSVLGDPDNIGKFSNERIREELVNLFGTFSNAVLESPASTPSQKQEAIYQQIELVDPTKSPEEVAEEANLILRSYAPTSFNSAGNASVSNFANAIKTVESSGNYQARGPVVKTGQYAGERALGAYQIMPGNLPSWSREALGREVSEQEFLENPALQDFIAQSRFNNLLQKHSPEDAASIWFTGRPLANNTSKDVTGTDAPEYVRRVISNLRA